MNASPIDSYEGAEAYFTYGPDSAGMWAFLVLAFAIFIYVGVRASQFESHGFEEIRTAADATPGQDATTG